MSTATTQPSRAEPQPLPENFPSVQPGGGACYQVELAWGRWRRWWLRRFRPGYVRRMAALRRGDPAGAPHEILDPRDLKYCRNRCSCYWEAADDPFRWRGRLPFARWGLAELQLMGWPLLALTILLAVAAEPYWYLALVPAVCLCLIVYFFRDPLRPIPAGPGLLVAPADGRVVEITRLGHDEFIGGPAVRIGIFLSIFNVHLNRAPAASRVIALRYSPGPVHERPESRERDTEREHVDRPGRAVAAASAADRAADLRGHRPADRVRLAAGRNARPGTEVRHDQTRLAARN